MNPDSLQRKLGWEELGSGLFEGGEGDGEEVDGVGSEGASSVRQNGFGSSEGAQGQWSWRSSVRS